MAGSQAATSISSLTFFGTCPTSWDNLTLIERESCIGNQLIRQIEGHFAWAAAGPLLEQWNSSGIEEYSAVIAHGKTGIFRNLRQHKIPGHELRLLSLLPDKGTAIPFVIITSREKDDKAAKEIIERLKHHPRIGRFALRYMIRQGNIRLTMGSHMNTGPNQSVFAFNESENFSDISGSAELPVATNSRNTEFPDTNVKNQKTLWNPKNLCGARIAVYSFSGRIRDGKSRVSTIAAVVYIKGRYYALTAAHVFFNNVDTSKSWADSGLFVTSENSVGVHSEIPFPKTSQAYEVVIESLWPHDKDLQDNSDIESTSIGLVAPSIPHRRQDVATAALPKVMWDAELDWALIELRNPALWQPNTLTTQSENTLSLCLPMTDIRPPAGEVLIAAGVSKEVNGLGLGTIGGILLPWSSQEVKTWSVEGEIAVGDSGSLAVCPKTGIVYGLVVAYDSDTLMTYTVPILSVFEAILRRFDLGLSSLPTLLTVPSIQTKRLSPTVQKDLIVGYNENHSTISNPKQAVHQLFLSKLKSFTAHSASGQPYIRKSELVDWLLSKGSSQAIHLELLLDFAYSDRIIVPVEANQLSNSSRSFLLVFSLLLEFGRGNLIHQFLRRTLTDSNLPFSMTSLEQVQMSGEQSGSIDLARQIFNKQWVYCPLTFDLRMSLDLPSSMVVPVQRKARINSKGGTASIWEIVIPENCMSDSLRRAAASAMVHGPSDERFSAYRFALKTFTSHNKSLYEKEIEAFRALEGNPQTVRCLGDYKHGEQYNILLEYGEVDLDEYFVANLPPELAVDITSFWESLFGIADALQSLHSFKLSRAGVQREYHGWHHDIKPDNILTIDGKFKLADPGFATFESMEENTTLLRGGSTTYEAPECYQARETRSKVSRAVDIWSLGCVLSEAACWVVLGESGIQQYSNVRKQANKRFYDEQSFVLSNNTARIQPLNRQFHNGAHVLGEVRQWHEHLRNNVRQTDVITAKVLDLVEQHMLLDVPEQRYTAVAVYSRLSGILIEATKDSVPLSRLQRTALALSSSTDLRKNSRSDGSLTVEASRGFAGPWVSSFTADNQDRQNHRLRSSRMSHFGSISPETRRPVEKSSQILTMTMANARKAMDKERRSMFSRLMRQKKDKYLARFIDNRDLVFLIDNSETMATHWGEVANVLETLAHLLHRQNPDGLKLIFTSGQVSCKSDSARKLKKMMLTKNGRPSEGMHTNMAFALAKVLSGFLKSLRLTQGQTKSLSIYVLTDGVWSGTPHLNSVYDAIHEFCTRFAALDRSLLKSERRVGIQFIQFGDKPDAISRLKMLDKQLPYFGIPDIVDTEPATGNVWKMLLGNFVDAFDYADDSD